MTKKFIKKLMLSLCTLCTLPPLYAGEAESTNEFSIIKDLRNETQLSLPTLLKGLSKLNLGVLTNNNQDVILKSRRVKTIVEAGTNKSCGGQNGTWQEVVHFDVAGNDHQVNLLITADCNKIDIKHMFSGHSMVSPEMFNDIAFPAIHNHLKDEFNLNIPSQNLDEFMKAVSFEIKKVSESTKEVLEEWTVFYKDKPHIVLVKIIPVDQGKFTFSIQQG